MTKTTIKCPAIREYLSLSVIEFQNFIGGVRGIIKGSRKMHVHVLWNPTKSMFMCAAITVLNLCVHIAISIHYGCATTTTILPRFLHFNTFIIHVHAHV